MGPGAASTQLQMLIGTDHAFAPVGIEFMGFYWSMGRILGKQFGYTEPDEANCDVLLFWGSNSYVSHNFSDSRKVLREFSENPDKMLLVVDPRVSETARMADIHILPRNGSDALMIRGLIAMILDKGWQDQAYLDKWALDFDKVRPWFEGFDYEKAFEVCGVPYAQMEELVKIMLTRSVGIHQDLGLFMNRHSTASSYLMTILMAVTGNLLVKGNVLMHGVISMPNTDERDPNHTRSPETNKFRVCGNYPSGVLSTELLSEKENRIRAMICCASNPARSYPDAKGVIQGLQRLEFSVCIDVAMTETAKYCDYVLPATNNYECYEFSPFQMSYPDVTLTLKHPVISRIAERKETGEIFLGIMKGMGLVPELPEELYAAAEKAEVDNDRVPFMLAVMQYLGEHPEMGNRMLYIVLETLGKAMGSVHKASLWMMLNGSDLAGTEDMRRAGFTPDPQYEALGPQVAVLSMADKVFKAVDEIPQGVVAAYLEYEDREKYAYEAITHPDHKLHLWCEEIEDYLERLTPEKEEAALKPDEEYPMLMSSGRHSEAGVNSMMRNPATYQYRKPYVVYMNPLDVEKMGFKEGQEVRVSTIVGSMIIPIECDWGMASGYLMIPHHFGFSYQGETYGTHVSELAPPNDIEGLTGNPHLRYIRCRVDAV